MNFPRRSRKENSFENRRKRGWQTEGDFPLMEGETATFCFLWVFSRPHVGNESYYRKELC